MSDSVIVWFRQDLRTEDNPALYHAHKSGLNVIPLYIWSPDTEGEWAPGSASQVWIHHSLQALEASLEKLGSSLLISQGDPLKILKQFIKSGEIKAVFWNRRYEPSVIQRDSDIKQQLKKLDIEVKSFNGSLLYEPHTIETKQGNPYKVYTAFWNATQALSEPEAPLPRIRKLQTDISAYKSLSLKRLNFLPRIRWDTKMMAYWQPGSLGAKKILSHFLQNAVDAYADQRDYPSVDGVSGLSPHLHLGEVSPNQIWHAFQQHYSDHKPTKAAIVFLKQLVWREFAHHLLFHFPHTESQPLRDEYKKFPWKNNQRWLQAWQQGITGYPIVDAGMRELWETGWMHNRVRMIVASFLIKDCLIHWREGANWFWDTLFDADLANNTMGWQWVAGSGADAAPYFRIFNPVTQSERFDSTGDYIRKWCPELTQLPNKIIHQPWSATPIDLTAANIKLGKDYPKPILNHAEARKLALAALGTMKDKH